MLHQSTNQSNQSVIVSCSNSLDQNSHNVVLSHYSTRSKLESFSNFQSNPPGVNVSTAIEAAAATSISFGGKAAKSRYLCVSDTSGAASVWDMKKISRVRCFKMKPMSNTSSTATTNNNTTARKMGRPSCIKSCMDPSDTHVVALHGSSPSCPMNHIVVELFHLKSGSRVARLNTQENQYGGGADCFEFSDVNDGTLLVGARDGSLLLWDVSMSGIKSSGTNGGNNAPMNVLEQRHSAAITDVAFSPMNKVLAASCSMDGTVGFHDIHSQQTIQTVTPWDGRSASIGSGSSGSSGAGLTSFAFHHDGYTWAVGTETGTVFTYDLRQTGQGPLCSMDLTSSSSSSTSITYPVMTLQFVQMKSATTSTLTGTSSSGTKPAVKKTVSLADDGAVTVEREKTTPSRKEISKTTYSVQKEDPPPVSASTSDASAMTDGTSSKRTERVVKRTTTTRKVFSSSSSPQRISGSGGSASGSSNLTSPDAEPNVERTTTSSSEFTTSSPQRPSTTKRITTTKVTTSSPQRSFASPPLSNLTKDLFAKDKKDMSVSFDNRVKQHAPVRDDLTFGDDNGSNSDSSEEEADQMMEDFDAMYERIKSRALTKDDKSASNSGTKLEYTENASTRTIDEEDDDSGDGILANDDSNFTRPTKLIDNETVGPPEIVREVSIMNPMKNDEEGDNPLITLRKSDIQDMIDEEADSLRDDVEASIHALQVDFLRQMQRQSDEVAAMLAHNQQEMQQLSIQNQELNKENERLRKFF